MESEELSRCHTRRFSAKLLERLRSMAMRPSLLDHARRYSSSGSLSNKAVQSPNLASRHDSRMLNDRAERGRKAQEHDRQHAAALSNIEAHKQRMSGQHLRVISGRHQQETQRLRTSKSTEAVNGLVERTVLLNALRLQQEADDERATTASEESAEQRRRRHHEHREYLARLRQEAHDREQAALRAIALKDEACRLAQERLTPALTPSLTLTLTTDPNSNSDPNTNPDPDPDTNPDPDPHAGARAGADAPEGAAGGRRPEGVRGAAEAVVGLSREAGGAAAERDEFPRGQGVLQGGPAERAPGAEGPRQQGEGEASRRAARGGRAARA